MGATAVDEVLARRFQIERPPTLVARRYPRAQIAFSRMRSDRPMRGRSMSVPPEAAFSFHVPLSVPFFSKLWTAGRRREVPDWRLGDAQLVDLSDNPIVSLDTPFDSLRFYIPQIALDEMANEAGIRRVKGLSAPNFGGRDLVMYGLAQALAGAIGRVGAASAMFCEHIAFAFFAHIVPVYGGVPIQQLPRDGLAPWQLRRALAFIDANLGADFSISEVATQCGLSGDYFGRAFKRATGFSPHRWLTKRRVERAKALLDEPDLPLAEIAEVCGFVDQSHFTRVFFKSEGCSPGRWRRYRRH